MSPLWVTLLGRPGAGKTTVGRALAGSSGFGLGKVEYVSGSVLLDDHIAGKPPDWEALKAAKDDGRTADPELTHTLLSGRIAAFDGVEVALLDGFPKAKAEIAMTETVLPQGAVDLAVLLDCPATECIARIERRLVCDSCGVVTNGQVETGASSACPKEGCDGALGRREDDGSEGRMRIQGHESAVVLSSYFNDQGRLVTVNALQPEGVVIEEVVASIRSLRGGPSPQNRD
jgi:adenylate kinase family enzyme